MASPPKNNKPVTVASHLIKNLQDIIVEPPFSETPDDSQHIYRFISLYELINLAKNKKLKLSLLAAQDDKNEGIGEILRFASPTLSCLFTRSEKVSQEYVRLINNTYVTCWTTDYDSIAMWLLYSPHQESIRIKTTVGKLRSALNDFEETNNWSKHLDYTDGSSLLTWESKLSQVKYVNLNDLLSEIDEFYSQYRNMCDNHPARGESDWHSNQEGFIKTFKELDKAFSEKFGFLNGFIKDSGFSHEKELRGLVRAGVRNSISADDWRASDDISLVPFSSAAPGVLPSFAYAETNDNFIEEICFDPRMPEYKRSVIRDALTPLSIQESESRCFGNLIKRGFSFDPIYGIKANETEIKS
ncbi:hypothetical protein [Stutzerimonas marianensis]